MRKPLILAVLLCAMFAGAATLTAWVQRPNAAELETPPGETIAVRGLLHARVFTLDHGYPFAWRAEHPEVRAGWLLVIQTDPALCIPTQEYERVLYVGEQTAERINTGQGSGRIVAVVPATLDARGEPDLDLARALIFWGAPRMPEDVNGDIAAAEQSRARSAGLAPFPAAEIGELRAQSGGVLACGERDDLVRFAAGLIERFAPPEAEFARGLLAPRVR